MRSHAARWAGVVFLACALAREAAPESLEPPPEAPDGADYEAEPADSVESGGVEVVFGAAGRAGATPRRTRTVRFNGDSLGGTLHDGDGDALAGGSLEGRSRAGSFGMGRLAPLWGRGLLLGSPSEPWSQEADDRGSGAPYRGHAGDGAWLDGGRGLRYQGLVGRFSRTTLAGAAVEARGLRLGALGDRGRERQASLSMAGESGVTELALDRFGRWRAEAALDQPIGPASLRTRVRGGHARFLSLAEPRRGGPADALTVSLVAPLDDLRLSALGAWWRFAPGASGARASLEAERRFSGRSRVLLGVEEQHGIRRPSAIPPAGRSGFRQGWWCEWSAGTADLALDVRHEGWGARRIARDPVRAVTTTRVESRAPWGTRVKVSHTVFRVRRGESLYLPEAGADRLVLRALSGSGERTRIEVIVPAGGGAIHAAFVRSSGEGRSARPQWTLEWMRRARLRRKTH